MNTRTSLVAVSAATLGLALTFGLSGCANPIDAISNQVADNIVENAVESQTGTDVEINGGTIPDSWPTDVPKPTQKIIAIFCDVASGCSGSFEASDAKGDYDSYIGKLESAGFTQTMDMTTDGSYMSMYDNGKQSVTVAGTVDTTSPSGNSLTIVTAPITQ